MKIMVNEMHFNKTYSINDFNLWDTEVVAQLIKTLMEELSLGKGKVMKPLRKAITGYESGPNLVDCLALFPLDTVKERVSLATNYVNTTTSN